MAALIRSIKPCQQIRTNSLSYCVKNYIFQNLNIKRFSPLISTSQFNKSRRKTVIFKDILGKFDRNIGITGDKFKDLFSILKLEQRISADDAIILLHICSTGPFDVSAEKRVELVTSLWSSLEEQGVSLNVQMYNLKLQALKIADFDPMQELARIHSLGLCPDELTFTLLIDAFCEKGDINGAQLMLEEMKKHKVKINIDVFNSFISGYLNAGQLDKAVETFGLISSRDLLPTSDTFHRFALFFAKRGDVVSIQYYIDKAKQWTCSLSQGRLLDIYTSLVFSGHTSEADQYLNQILSNIGVFHAKAFEIVCQLVAEGFAEEAKNLYRILPALSSPDDIESGYGVFLLTAMVKNSYSAKSLMGMADDIAEFMPHSQPHGHVLLQTYNDGLPDLALELLELMIADNHDMNIPYFLPAMCQFGKQNNLSQLIRTTSLMLTQDYKNCMADLVHELMFCVLPAFYKLGLTRQDILNNHKNYTTLWNSVFFIQDVLIEDLHFAICKFDAEQLEAGALQYIRIPVNALLHKHLNEDWEMQVKAMLDFFPQNS